MWGFYQSLQQLMQTCTAMFAIHRHLLQETLQFSRTNYAVRRTAPQSPTCLTKALRGSDSSTILCDDLKWGDEPPFHALVLLFLFYLRVLQPAV